MALADSGVGRRSRATDVAWLVARVRVLDTVDDEVRTKTLARERAQGCTARPSRRHRELAMGRRDERSGGDVELSEPDAFPPLLPGVTPRAEPMLLLPVRSRIEAARPSSEQGWYYMLLPYGLQIC